ncbi:peptidylprolyl isomerase [Urechidicola sp. KH5]
MTQKLSFLFLLISSITLSAQQDKTVLFSIEEQPVYIDEFMRVYNKNLDVLSDDSQKDVESYFELFLNYKLKVQQARDLGLDTLPSYVNELKGYKQQLMEPYLKDESTLDSLVKEAYDRSLYEVNASHILVQFDPKNPTDTVIPYKRISEALEKIRDGASFDSIAKQYSQDPSVQRNNGNLGYFTAFSMVYPFESSAYKTEVGEVSEPFKTRFGYHILKVIDKRKARGQIEASHIMIRGDSLPSETKIKEIYVQLEGGESFEYLAKTQSEDTYSAQKEGSLGKFGSGRMVPEFEKEAFALEVEGSYSKPFKTNYGWHIVKLIKKYPIGSFDETKESIVNKVKRGERADIVNNSIVNKLKKQYNLTVDTDLLDQFAGAAVLSEKQLNDVLVNLEDTTLTAQNFNDYLRGRAYNRELFNTYLNAEVIKYYKAHLEETNPNFAFTFNEYKEGLLLFELLQQKVWDAGKDSIALESYYNTHTSKYISKKSFKGAVITCNTKKLAKIARKQLLKNVAVDSLKNSYSDENAAAVLVKSGTFNSDSFNIPEDFDYQLGISKIIEFEKKFIIVKIDEINESRQQTLDEVRGQVISDYQDKLEKDWVTELRNLYDVSVNDKALKELIAQ